jgi:hypothetical protein
VLGGEAPLFGGLVRVSVVLVCIGAVELGVGQTWTLKFGPIMKIDMEKTLSPQI